MCSHLLRVFLIVSLTALANSSAHRRSLGTGIVVPFLYASHNQPSINISIGGVPVLVNIDTGSSNLAIPARTCHACVAQLGSLSAACRQGYFNETCQCGNGGVSINPATLVPCSSSLGQQCTTHNTTFYTSALGLPSNIGSRVAQCSCLAPSLLGITDPSLPSGIAVSSLSYGDASGFFGPIFQDHVTLGNSPGPFSTTTTSYTAMIYKTTDFSCNVGTDTSGIMGMAYSSINSYGALTPFESLVASGAIPNIFSICLAYTPLIATQTVIPVGQAGQMVLGGVGSPDLAGGPLAYTPMVTGTGFYTIFLQDILLGTTSLGQYL